MNEDIESNLIAHLLMCTTDNQIIGNYIKLYNFYGFSEVIINSDELQKIYNCCDKSVRNYNYQLEEWCLLKKHNPLDKNGKKQIAIKLRHPKEALQILQENTAYVKLKLEQTRKEEMESLNDLL